MSDAEARWQGVNLAVACFALCPNAMGGLWVKARVGPVRERLEHGLKTALQGLNLRRISPTISDDALFGGLDLAATLDLGVLTQTKGLLSEADVLLLPMAERVEAGLSARLAQALDGQKAALIAFDEGAEPGERLPEALADRMALHIDLSDHPMADAPDLAIDLDALAEARAALPGIGLPENTFATLTETALRLGVYSLRAPLHALAVARASAALSGAEMVEEPDLLTAIELVLAPRATLMPEPAPDDVPEQNEPDTPPDDTPEGDSEMSDAPPPEVLLEAARALLPPDLLARLAAGKAAKSGQGGSGARKTGNRRGRPLPPRPGRLDGQSRVDLVATLRAAAPWQPIRRASSGVSDKIHIRLSDLRLRRFQETSDRAIIFVVDASGSAAMARLAEAKGAVELLLAEAYARRDHVALVAFRGEGAEVLLPPTRSLVQTKRRLATLPGGGGTPLAAGLKAALELSALAKGKGMTPSIALLTDGRANVDLNGEANRAQAGADATDMARVLRAEGTPGVVIDTGLRPTRGLDALARDMGAPYLPLPARRQPQPVPSRGRGFKRVTGLPPPDWPNRSYSRSVALSPNRWHVQQVGAGTDALMLHGAGASAHSFAPLMELLSSQYCMFVPDLPGHGFTQSPRGRARLPDVAVDIGALLKDQSVRPKLVIAHSAGAAIALQMVLQGSIAPDRLILLNGALEDFRGAAGVLFPIMAKMLALNPFTGLFLSSGQQSVTQARSIIRTTGSDLSEAHIAPYAHLIGMRSHIDGTLSMMAGWSLAELNRNLHRVEVPTLFLHGERDSAVSPSVAIRAAKAMPHAEFQQLPGLGHLAHEEAPDVVASAIANFAAPVPAQ